MSKFHSTLTRRNFMKTLGFGAAGLGAAAAAAPVFHDLDEVISSAPGPIHPHPWWVKERDYMDITSPHDWSKITRFDQRNVEQCSFQGVKQNRRLYDEREGDGAYAAKMVDAADRKTTGITGGDKWYGNLAYAIGGTIGYGSSMDSPHGFEGPKVNTDLVKAGGPAWNGTPEENSQIMKAVMRLYGAADVSFAVLDDVMINFIHSHDFHDGKAYIWEDVDEPYETGQLYTNKLGSPPPANVGKRVIPNKVKYEMNFTIQLSMGPSRLGFADRRYGDGRMIQLKTQKFLKQLGFIGIGPVNYTNNFSENVAFAVCGGQTEQARHNYSISPYFGSVLGVSASIITDMPLAPTNPIDAGIHQFCKSCMKCAELCPSGAISRQGKGPDGPIVIEPTWDTVGPHQRWPYRTEFEKRNPDLYVGTPGQNQESFYANWWYVPADCRVGRDICGAFACANRCVFAKHTDSNVHDLVLGTIATTPIFNSFFRTMDDFFGYADGKDVRNSFGTKSEYAEDLYDKFWSNQAGVENATLGIDSNK